MVVEIAEPGCFFFVTRARTDDKTDKTRFYFLKKEELGTQQTFINLFPISINQLKKERIVCGQQSTRDYWRCVLSKM